VTTRSDRPHLLRFALPSSLGNVEGRVRELHEFLQGSLQRELELTTPTTYEQLARVLLAGEVDAAWAPPFVCARVEAMGVRVLVRGVRAGASVYRAALLCRKSAALTLDTLKGATAAWSDRDSVGGYLLPMAFLRERGLDIARTFARQEFHGNYRKALEALDDGRADLTSLFAPTPKAGGGEEITGVVEVWPERVDAFRVLAFTDEAPNDGVAVSISASPGLVADLEKALLSMHHSPSGRAVLKACFAADRFELAPRLGYRALYRVALASV
jgi:phosphonate transport system substrate-binding protein